MKRIIIFILAFIILAMPYGMAETKSPVYVIPVKGEVNPALVTLVTNGIEKAETNGASLIIFDIDTLGGRIDSSLKISDAIIKSNIPTLSYINNRAISAGVAIAISSDKVVVSSRATIGAAETIPYSEKNVSFWAGELRDIAENKGRNPKIIAAMADKDIEIPGVIEKGKLLTLTSNDAVKHGIADYQADGLKDILEKERLTGAPIVDVKPNLQIRIAQFASSVTWGPIILSLAMICMLIELFTPSFGLFGTLSVALFALYFGGNILAGYAGYEVLIMFVAGLLLLFVEAFMPGFGVAGIGGVVLIFLSVIISAQNITQAMITLGVSFIISIVALVLIIRYAPKSKFYDRIILKTSLSKEAGFEATTDYNVYEGKEGIAITTLRPAGIVEVDGKRLDVVTDGAYIEAGSRVRITAVEGRRIIVKRKEDI
ncbi:MAG: NfeD family protein [Thermoanaerobacteraceae bacterium]|nr:NfeD family protein [Thermoanaerobacteraceae bacterium]